MTQVNTDNILSTIRDYITVQLLAQKDLKLPQDARLVEQGYLTSLQAVELVMFLEERFKIEIPPEEVDEHNFGTLRNIALLVEGKLR